MRWDARGAGGMHVSRVVRSLHVPAPGDRRVIWIPDDYRIQCDLGWLRDGYLVLDAWSNKMARGSAGQVLFLDADDVPTIPAPAR